MFFSSAKVCYYIKTIIFAQILNFEQRLFKLADIYCAFFYLGQQLYYDEGRLAESGCLSGCITPDNFFWYCVASICGQAF